MNQYVEVAIPGTYKDSFTYLWPASQAPHVGIRVKVPFKNNFKTGIVIAVSSKPEIAHHKLKPIEVILDELPLLDSKLFALALWVAKYYFIPTAEVFNLLFPKLERQIKPLRLKKNESWCQNGAGNESPHAINKDQAIAVTAILASINKFNCFLLCGVTGSGKTEVYLQVMAHVLSEGKQVLVLLPEIALMNQWISRFTNRFNAPYVVMHSGLTDRERQKAWHAVRQNHAQVIFASRSGVLAPCQNLGMIILDEEHDASFRQHEKFHYSARDVAIFRAKNYSIPIILGSATPSLESLQHAQNGKYSLLRLPNRVVAAHPLKISLENTRASKPKHGLTVNTINKITDHLSQNNQVLIFLNRRGYAPVLYCYQCGWMVDCPRCTAHLTWHKNKKTLVCHHCSYQKSVMPCCPNGHQDSLVPVGIGTQRLDDYLIEKFPEHHIIRMDKDEINSIKTRQQQFDKIFSGEAKIIIGTQMMAKGHHFPDLTLVVIVDVDQGLYHPDFRSTEQLGQLISQVAGRAGRENKAGEVILQTAFPEHQALNILLRNGYLAFLDQLLQDRKLASLPPFSYMALINAEANRINLAISGLKKIKNSIQPIAHNIQVSLLGPAPALLVKKAGAFRAKLLLKSATRSDLHNILSIIQTEILKQKTLVKFFIEVDPSSIV